VGGINTNDDGIVTATITGISVDVDGKLVSLAPLIRDAATIATTAGANNGNMGQGLFGWRCGSTTDGTTVSSKFLPGSCRGA
jgi:type IV pilus assembly protein PilA